MKRSKFEKMWFHWLNARLILAIAVLMAGTTCLAVDYGAITDGIWNDSSTWTPTGTPGAEDEVYIGSYYYPDGAAPSATVTLDQNQSANDVYLGYDGYGLSTLNLGDYKLSIGGSLYIGNSGGSTGTVNRGSGSFSASSLWLDGSSMLTLGALDNVTGNVEIHNGSTLTLGANMTLSGNLAVEEWGSTLDMTGHAISANQIFFGGYKGGSITLLNQGQFTANDLSMERNGNAISLHPGDLIENSIWVDESTLTVQQANGQLSGLTLNGTSPESLYIGTQAVLDLQFGQSRFSHWIFRWRDPNSSSNWCDALTGLIDAGQISISPSNGYLLADSAGYTYIYTAAQPADFDWKGGNIAGPTDWSLTANWNPSTGVPYGKGVTVSFGNQSSANNIVDLGSEGKTVGNIIFLSATSTTIQSSGGHDLTLDNNGDISTIDVTGNHCIATPVILNNDAQIAGIGILTLSGGISGPHNLDVQNNLIASSIEVDTLTIENGATVTIQAIPGGPMGSTITAVPEPSTLVLIVIGSIGLLAYAWRRRKPVA